MRPHLRIRILSTGSHFSLTGILSHIQSVQGEEERILVGSAVFPLERTAWEGIGTALREAQKQCSRRFASLNPIFHFYKNILLILDSSFGDDIKVVSELLGIGGPALAAAKQSIARTQLCHHFPFRIMVLHHTRRIEELCQKVTVCIIL